MEKRLIASLTTYKPDILKRNWGAFQQMRGLCDVVIVLCDSCHVFDAHWQKIAGGIRIDETIEVNNQLGWEDYTNRMTLLTRAAAHHCDWVLWLDDDEVLQGATRSKILEYIDLAEKLHRVAVRLEKREMWTDRHFRNDGIWKKQKLVLQKNPMLQLETRWRDWHLRRLHALPLQEGEIMDVAGSRLLHYGMSTPELREARVRKYRLADPGNKFQPEGYDYMLDETGIELVQL